MLPTSVEKMNVISFFRKTIIFMLLSLPLFGGLYAQNGSPKAPASVNSTFVITMIILMIIFLLIIGLLANVVVSAAKYKAGKYAVDDTGTVVENVPPVTAVSRIIVSILLVAAANNVSAQEAINSSPVSGNPGGLSNTAYYLIVGVFAIQMLVIIFLLLQLRSILKEEKALARKTLPRVFSRLEWKTFWSRLNAFKPREREPELDLGHDYDGIRELDNRLPPWWLYGFYLTIVVAALYLWRYHVAESAPLSIGEYQIAVQQAAIEHEAYLKLSASQVDENTVTLLTSAEALMAGKKVYELNCSACHGKSGEGIVGPNLTDEYWMHGGSIKDIFKSIKYGWSEKGMKSWKDDLSPVQIAQISTYIKTIAGTNPPNAKEKQGEIYKEDASAGPNTDSSKAEAKMILTTQ